MAVTTIRQLLESGAHFGNQTNRWHPKMSRTRRCAGGAGASRATVCLEAERRRRRSNGSSSRGAEGRPRMNRTSGTPSSSASTPRAATHPRQRPWIPHSQQPARRMIIVARTAADPLSLSSALRGAVAAMDKNLAVSNISAMEEITAQSIGQERFTLLLLGVFSALALSLAVAGIYGVMSYAVAQRTHEIGVRVALGAQARDVLKLVVAQGMALVLAGVGIGLASALALTGFIRGLLFGVSATDPLTLVAVAALLALVALVACYVPARSASKVDPMVALRCE